MLEHLQLFNDDEVQIPDRLEYDLNDKTSEEDNDDLDDSSTETDNESFEPISH
jgi:hypothetical protein